MMTAPPRAVSAQPPLSSLTASHMNPTPIEESHAELMALKDRLRKHDAEGAAIDQDLADATKRARAARLPMDEIADCAGVTRSTLYSSLRRAKNQAAKSRPGTQRSNPPKKTNQLHPGRDRRRASADLIEQLGCWPDLLISRPSPWHTCGTCIATPRIRRRGANTLMPRHTARSLTVSSESWGLTAMSGASGMGAKLAEIRLRLAAWPGLLICARAGDPLVFV
jgi:hypothetical protein